MTDAMSLCGHMRKTDSINKDRQAIIDLLVIKSLVENSVTTTYAGRHLDT